MFLTSKGVNDWVISHKYWLQAHIAGASLKLEGSTASAGTVLTVLGLVSSAQHHVMRSFLVQERFHAGIVLVVSLHSSNTFTPARMVPLASAIG